MSKDTTELEARIKKAKKILWLKQQKDDNNAKKKEQTKNFLMKLIEKDKSVKKENKQELMSEFILMCEENEQANNFEVPEHFSDKITFVRW